MRENVCIVTEQFDPHADRVLLRMRERGFDPIRIHLDELVQNGLTLGHGFEDFGGGILRTNKRRIPFNQIEAIWWRRPLHPSPQPNKSTEFNSFVSRELHYSFYSVWHSLDCMWMSDPGCIMRASLKVDQLLRAKTLGFKIPRTLITNSQSEAREFANKLSGAVLMKPLTDYFNAGFQSGDLARTPQEKNPISSKNLGVYARIVSERDIANSGSSIKNCPCQFQEYVEKDFELRVTVIGDKVFAAKIDSQKQNKTMVDWRHYEVPILLSEYLLPDDIAEKCIRFIASYNLTFGAFDFIVTRAGEFVFLECEVDPMHWTGDRVN